VLFRSAMVRSAQALAFYLATSGSSRHPLIGFRIGRRTISSTTHLHMVSDIAANLKEVRDKILRTSDSDVRLVAVSKTKPKELLMECYQEGQRVFGENYVQELVEKALVMPNDITWHFIGPLQSNKAKLLVSSVIPNAAALVVETVATLKLAKKLQSAMEECAANDNQKKLDIFVQVNTSGEDSKSGLAPSEVVDLCKQITEECPLLNLKGLMTIGAPGDLECFDVLRACRDETASELGLSSLELSMGMSDDFQQAIAHGATNVRVGSTIFGARDYSNK